MLGRRTVVFSPNTAIQGQWARTWDSYDGARAGTRRDLRTGFTSLTYQSLAVFDEDAEEPAARVRTSHGCTPTGSHSSRPSRRPAR